MRRGKSTNNNGFHITLPQRDDARLSERAAFSRLGIGDWGGERLERSLSGQSVAGKQQETGPWSYGVHTCIHSIYLPFAESLGPAPLSFHV